MPLEVHCPNPACARIHLVKNKYAGMRGRCPACQSWMYIPVPAAAPSVQAIDLPPIQEPAPWEQPRAARKSVPAVEPALAEEATLWDQPKPARKPAPKVETPPAEETVAWEPPPKPARKQPAAVNAPTREEEATLLVEPEPPGLDEPPRGKVNRRPPPGSEWEIPPPPDERGEPVLLEEEDGTKPKRHFSWVAVIFLVLALLSLGVAAASPFLPGPTLEATGAFATSTLKPQGLALSMPLIAGFSGGVAFLTVLALLPALILRRLGLVNLVLVYLATIGGSLLLFSSLDCYFREAGPQGTMAKIQKSVSERKEKGEQGDVTLSLGLQYYALAAGASGACLALLLSALFMHRRLWSKLVGFLFLGFWPALAVAWVFRTPLGIDAFDLPLPTF